MKYLLWAGSLLFLVSCANNPSGQEASSEEANPTEEVQVASSQLDPVCKMEYETTWTEYHVQDGDTTWFCSETCKDAFAANPAKYMK